MKEKFEMAAKTLAGLELTLAEELRDLGATAVQPGKRVVTFMGDQAMLYRANLACRTAVSILKPIYKFTARNEDALYEMVKEFDWSQYLDIDKTFSIDTVSHSNEFTHSRFVTYRVKDAIADHFQDRLGLGKRPSVRLNDADVQLNVHIDGERITLSLNSSGESLHKRGWRVAQTDAPIDEVLAAGIVLRSGYRGDCPFVDPMCGSGTFLIEAALIASNIWPGTFKRKYAFQKWNDFDPELFDQVLGENLAVRKEPAFKLYGSDISPQALEISAKNAEAAGVDDLIVLRHKALTSYDEAPSQGVPGIMVTNPPYGKRLRMEDIEDLYTTLGNKLKRVFLGYHAWVISSNEDCLAKIGLAPSTKLELNNGGLDCQLREYVIFEGSKREFREGGGSIKEEKSRDEAPEKKRRLTDEEWRRKANRSGLGAPRHKNEDREGSFKKREGGFRRREDGDREGGFKKREGGFRRREDGDREGGFKKREGGFKERKSSDETPREELSEVEQVLNRRRNPALLKLIERRKQPTMPPEGPIMRSRKKKDK